MPETGWAAWLADVGMVVAIYGMLFVVSKLALWMGARDHRRAIQADASDALQSSTDSPVWTEWK